MTKCPRGNLCPLPFLLRLQPLCILLLLSLSLRLLVLSFCRLCVLVFDHGLGRLLARRLHEGLESQVIDVVREHANIDHRLERGVRGLTCVVAVPSPRMTRRS